MKNYDQVKMKKMLTDTTELLDHTLLIYPTFYNNEINHCGAIVTLSKALDASSLYRPIYPLDISAVLL